MNCCDIHGDFSRLSEIQGLLHNINIDELSIKVDQILKIKGHDNDYFLSHFGKEILYCSICEPIKMVNVANLLVLLKENFLNDDTMKLISDSILGSINEIMESENILPSREIVLYFHNILSEYHILPPSSIIQYATSNLYHFYPYKCDSIEWIILKDDIGSLINQFQENGLNSSYEIINIFKSFYSFSDIKMDLIQFSALCGSNNCYQYLHSTTALSDDFIKYAIAGGNINIVKDCYHSGINFEEALIIATKSRHFEVVQFLLNQSFSLYLPSLKYIEIILYYSSINNFIDGFLESAQYKPNFNVMINHYTPLLVACARNHVVIIKYLICKCNECINYSYKSFSPLTISIEFGFLSTFQFLFSCPQLNIKIYPNNQSLLLAVEKGNFEMVANICNNTNIDYNIVNNMNETAIILASKHGFDKIVDYLASLSEVDLNCGDYNGATALHHASFLGNLKCVETLVSYEGININSLTLNHETPVYLCCKNGHQDVLNHLIERGSNLLEPDSRGYTPLHIAAENGHIECLDRLLSSPAIIIDSANHEGETALYFATINGNFELINLLFKSYPKSINITTSFGLSPVSISIMNHRIDITELYLSSEDIDLDVLDNFLRNYLHVSVYYNSLEIFMLLLNHRGFDINNYDSQRCSILMTAIHNCNRDIVFQLLQQSQLNINHQDKKGRNALCYAAESGDIDILSALINHNDFDYSITDNEGLSPLHYAALNGQINALGFFFQYLHLFTISLNKNTKRNILYSAIESGKLPVVEFVLSHFPENSFDINDNQMFSVIKKRQVDLIDFLVCRLNDLSICDFDTSSPLVVSVVENGILSTLQILVSKGVDLNQLNRRHESAFFVACMKGYSNIVNYLSQLETVDINIPDLKGRSPLYMACEIGNIEIARMLCQLPINVNQTNFRNQTPLFISCLRGNKDIVELLLSSPKIDINMLNVDNESPLYISILHGHTEIVSLLMKHPDVTINNISLYGDTELLLAQNRNIIPIKDLIQQKLNMIDTQ